MTRVAVLQSNYLPWKGYFDIIRNVDLFVFYDDVQFTKNDWRNRNRIKTPRGTEWLSVPVGRDIRRLTCEVEIQDSTWQTKHLQKLQEAYQSCPFFADYADFLKDIFVDRKWQKLSDLNQHIIRTLAKDFLGIQTEFADSRKFPVEGKSLARLLDLLQKVGATSYLSGPSARSYIREEDFAAAGVQLEYIDYSQYPEYEQPYPPFEHSVSILDLLFCCGPASPRFMSKVSSPDIRAKNFIDESLP